LAKKYSTAFATTEDPLSETGNWVARVNTILTDMYVSGGRAIAHALGVGAYDDSAALLSGYSTDVEITCTVFKDPTINTGATHECELLFRASQTSSESLQYESLFSFNGTIQFIRWFDNGGSQDFAVITVTLGPETLSRNFITGDKIRARAAGSVFTLSSIDSGGTETLLGVYVNTVLTTGQPGIGGFTRSLDGGDTTKFCFEDAQISDIFIDLDLATDDFNRANENPLSGGGNWSSSSDMNALKIVGNEVLTVTANSDSGMRYTGVSAGIDHYSEITISAVGDHDFGAAVCMQPSGDCYLTTNYDSSIMYIFSRIGGSFNELNHVSGVYANSDVIRLERFGDELRLYQNGTLKLTITDETSLVGGTFGIFGFDGNFRVTSFTGGKLVADYDAVPGSSTTYTNTLTSNTILIDALIFSAYRNNLLQDLFTLTDQTVSGSIRNTIATDSIIATDQIVNSIFRNALLTSGVDFADGFIAYINRNRSLQSSIDMIDQLISAAGALIAMVLSSNVTVSDELRTYINRNRQSESDIDTADGFIAYLLRNRRLESDIDFIDEIISVAGSILSKILTSTFLANDEVQTSALRQTIGSDFISIVDSTVLQYNLTRLLESSFEITDESLDFKKLTRIMESFFAASDSVISTYVPEINSMFDGSKIKVGFRREPISIGFANIF
jgi:hypothetical protein